MKREVTALTLEQYHRNLRICRILIRKSKRDHGKRIAREAKPNPKKFFFTYIRTKNNIKNNIGPIANESGVLTQDTKQMAEILNTNFSSICTIENPETVPESPHHLLKSNPLKLTI